MERHDHEYMYGREQNLKNKIPAIWYEIVGA